MFANGILAAVASLNDEDDELVLALALAAQGMQTRRVKWRHERLNWAQWVKYLDHTGSLLLG